METAEAVTRQSANAASLSTRTAELERSGMPLSTTTKSGGWRKTSRRAPVQARRHRSTGSLGVDAEEQTPRRYDHRGSRTPARCHRRSRARSIIAPRAPVETHVRYVAERQPRPSRITRAVATYVMYVAYGHTKTQTNIQTKPT